MEVEGWRYTGMHHDAANVAVLGGDNAVATDHIQMLLLWAVRVPLRLLTAKCCGCGRL